MSTSRSSNLLRFLGVALAATLIAVSLLLYSQVSARHAHAGFLGVQPAAWQSLSTSSSTLASLYNSDGNDRIITGIFLYSPQENTTQTLTLATSSSASANTGTTIVSFPFATTSSASFYASTTMAFTASNGVATSTNTRNLIWKAGSYLNLIGTQADASTTNGQLMITYIQL